MSGRNDIRRATAHDRRERIALAWGLRAFGDPARAREELVRARETFARMEARGVVDQIDRELDELAKGPGPSGPFAAPTSN